MPKANGILLQIVELVRPEIVDERVNLIRAADAGPTVERLRTKLLAAMAATGLTPQNDTMPLDAGIKTELPAQSIR